MHFSQKISIQLIEVLDNAPPNNDKKRWAIRSYKDIPSYGSLRLRLPIFEERHAHIVFDQPVSMAQPFPLVTPLGWQYLSVKASETLWLDPARSSKMVRTFHLQALECKWGPLTCHRQFEGPRSHQPFGGRERHRLLPRGLELHYRCMEIVAFLAKTV